MNEICSFASNGLLRFRIGDTHTYTQLAARNSFETMTKAIKFASTVLRKKLLFLPIRSPTSEVRALNRSYVYKWM